MMSSIQGLSSEPNSEAANQTTTKPPATPATSIQPSSQAKAPPGPKTPKKIAGQPQVAEKDNPDIDGYTTDEEIEAVFTIWKRQYD